MVVVYDVDLLTSVHLDDSMDTYTVRDLIALEIEKRNSFPKIPFGLDKTK